MKAGLSVSLIVKNEEKYLDGCLESVRNVADEIIVVDTGSVDRTVEIARKHNASVYNYKWNDDFADARNFALSKCNFSVVLYIDADERLKKESLENLKNIVKSNPQKKAWHCSIINYDNQTGIPKIFQYPRLFCNSSGIGFTGKVHEQILPALKKNNYELLESGVEIDHIGYDVDVKSIRAKASRNLKLLLVEFEKNPNGYYAYQLGNTYTILEDYEASAKFFAYAINKNDLSEGELAAAYTNLINYETGCGKTEHAQQVFERRYSRFRDIPYFLMAGANMYSSVKLIKKAFFLYKEACYYNSENMKGYSAGKDLVLVYSDDKLHAAGLSIALKTGDMEFLTYTLNQLKNAGQKELVNLIVLLYYNKSAGRYEEPGSMEYVTKDFLDPVLQLLENYTFNKISHIILERLEKLYPSLGKINTVSGLLYMKTGLTDPAAVQFEKAVSKEVKDAPAFFYLVSILLKNNRLAELSDTFGRHSSSFDNNPQVRTKINLLKNRLKTYLN